MQSVTCLLPVVTVLIASLYLDFGEAASVQPDLNGQRLKDPYRPHVFLILDGRRSWVPSPNTYNQLFRNWKTIHVYGENVVEGIEEGPALSEGAFLGKSKNSDPVYLFSNGQKRHVVSPAAMDKYYFDWKKIRFVDNLLIDSVPTGPSIA